MVALAERYHRAGDIALAAETLRDGSVEWNDARLMAMAASLFLETKDHPQARECAQEALRMAGPSWAGQGRMYALLVEAESADGRLDRATDAALRLLELDPLDIDARWALVKCYALRSLLDQAWQALTTGGQGRPLSGHLPRNDSESINPRCPSSTERSQHQVSTGSCPLAWCR
ncbi:tetratricopeptide repeat protein [Streptomyces cellulosae]